MAAINEGKVFRFFTKPCPIPVLIEGIDLAISSRKAMEEAEKLSHPLIYTSANVSENAL